MSVYADAARSICAFAERCGNKPAARRAAVRSVAAHRHLDERRLWRVVCFAERVLHGQVKLVPYPLDYPLNGCYTPIRT